MSSEPTLPIRQALDASEPLARLAQRLRESQQRFDAVCPALPPLLQAHVRPGPIDEAGWSLLAANGAVAAKLRQLVPVLQQRLATQGWAETPIRVKVLTPG